jgi:hypothetical protein
MPSSLCHSLESAREALAFIVHRAAVPLSKALDISFRGREGKESPVEMARPTSLLPTLVLVFATCLISVRSESVFVQPPPSGQTGDFEDNQEYEVGDVIDVQWESDLELMDVWLWQDYPPLDNGLFRYFQVNG